MYFDFYVAKNWVYLPAASVATVYKQYTEPGYTSNHHLIDPEKYILFYTMAGEGVVVVDGSAFSTTANTVLFANASISLNYRCTAPNWNFWLVEFKTGELFFHSNLLYHLPFRPEYHDLFNATLESLKEDDPMLSAAYFQTLRCRMHRDLRPDLPVNDRQPFSLCLEYIEDHLNQFSVQRFCEDTGISARTLHNLFLRAVGVSPYQYYQRLRVERSKEYLENTDMTVAQIAAALGYANSGHFSRVFKGYFGVTPRRYRADFRLAP